MSKAKHTPTTDLSLGLDEISDVICLMKGDIDIAYMAFPGVQGRKYGERILKALNNHDRLVEALEDARLMLSQLSRSVMAHPDHLISGAQIIEDRIEKLLTELKS